MRGRSASARLVVFLLARVIPGAVAAQVNPSSPPLCPSVLRQAELVVPGAGWAVVEEPVAPRAEPYCSSPLLLWTDTNGQTWTDISPPHVSPGSAALVYFLDRDRGWVVSTEPAGEKDAPPQTCVLATEDRGKSWRTFLLKESAPQWNPHPLAVQVFFAGTLHGWISWRWPASSSPRFALLATEDGGSTWKQLPDPPGAGQFEFVTAQLGWMIGGAAGPSGSASSGADAFWSADDGGMRWRAVKIPLPPPQDAEDAEDEPATFGPFEFIDSLRGFVIAQRQISDLESRVFTCVTRNGGAAWHIFASTAYHARPSFVGPHIIWSFSDWPARRLTLHFPGYTVSPALAAGVPPGGSLGDVDFIDDRNGWTTYRRNGRSDLAATADGGKTFALISPAVLSQAPPR